MKTNTDIDTALQRAYSYLLITQTFDQITVSQLARTAHIGRGTFYLHYTDKDDMVRSWSDQIVQDAQQLLAVQRIHLPDTAHPELYRRPVVAELMTYVDGRRELLATLLGPNGDNQLRQRINGLLVAAIQHQLNGAKGNQQFSSQLPPALSVDIIISGIFSILDFWLQQDKPLSVSAVTDIIMASRFLSPFDLLGIPQPPRS